MAVALVGMGSNLGDRRALLDAAADRLITTPGIQRVAISGTHETRPVGGSPGQPWFLNAAARLETTLEPETLLRVLLAIEEDLGRERPERWGPRTIDLDLLLYDDRVIDTPELTLPHPRLHERRFVLEPLAEIAADRLHPILNRTVSELLSDLPSE